MVDMIGTIDKLAEAIKLLATNGIEVRIIGGQVLQNLSVSDPVVPSETVKDEEPKPKAEPKKAEKKADKKAKKDEKVEQPETEVAPQEAVEEKAEAKSENKTVELTDVRAALIALREAKGDPAVAEVFSRCGCKNMRDLTPELYGRALEFAKAALEG